MTKKTNQLKKEQFTDQKLVERTEEFIAAVGLTMVVVTTISMVVVRAFGFYLLDKIKGK